MEISFEMNGHYKHIQAKWIHTLRQNLEQMLSGSFRSEAEFIGLLPPPPGNNCVKITLILT